MQAMRARRALIPGILAVAVTVLSACGKDNKPPAAQTPEVKVVTLKDENVTLDSSLPGRTMPYRIAEVRPQVNGILQKRLFVEGSDVKQGQQLYQIDPSTYEATAKSAEANLESARLLAERYGKLVGEEAVSKQQYAEAQASYLQAKAAVDQAHINPALHQGPFADFRPYQPIARHRRRAGNERPGQRAGNDSAARSDLCGRDPAVVGNAPPAS
jgi:membrane fusion protein (multidrug efflux system)